MANTKYQGVNYAKIVGNPYSLVEEGQVAGSVRKLYDSFVLTADLASGDQILMGSFLPQGARVTNCTITTGALGGSCTINVGWLAGPTGLEAAAPTGFFSALPVSSATVANAHGSTYEGAFYQKIFLEQVQPVIAENAVSSGATGAIISIEISYLKG